MDEATERALARIYQASDRLQCNGMSHCELLHACNDLREKQQQEMRDRIRWENRIAELTETD